MLKYKLIMRRIFTFILILIDIQLNAQTSLLWNTTQDLASSSFGNNHPRIVMNGTESPVVVWGRDSDASLLCSYWDGTKFSTPLKLNTNITIATASWMGPDIAAHGDTIYVVMKQTPENSSNSGIYLSKSFDGGKSFSSLIRVDKIADSLSRFPTVATDKNGQPIIAFMKFNSNFRESRWVVTKSNDFGKSFSQDIKASNWFGSEEVCDCCPGTLISDGMNTVLMYRDNNKNIRDSWMALSKDGGNTFINACNVDNNRWQINTCPASGPDAVIVGDTLYSVFMNGASGRALNYMSKTILSEAKLVKTSAIQGPASGLNSQNFPRISAYGNAAAIVWRQDVSNKLQLPILFTKNIYNGFPTKYDTVDLLDIDDADVLVTKDKVFVVWEDFASRTVKYRVADINTITDIQLNQKPNQIIISPNPASDQIEIHADEKINELTITDLKGNVIYQSQNPEKLISLYGLSSGIYLVYCRMKTGVAKQKFCKQ